MRLGIAILAHNEAARIERMLQSLSQQSIVKGRLPELEGVWITCVANGCTDRTAVIARDTLSQIIRSSDCVSEQVLIRHDVAVPCTGSSDLSCDRRREFTGVIWDVHELDMASKTNAWNECIHRILPQTCELICLLDADIWFLDPDAILKVVRALMASPNAHVATDVAIKDLSLKKRRSLFDRLSLLASAAPNSLEAPICGQFYCGRSEVLRRIWMPVGLPVEDGFLGAMVVTEGFQKPADHSRVVHVLEASHYFEACRSLGELFRHERRLVIGTVINSFVFDFLWSHKTVGGAGGLIRQAMMSNPRWLGELVQTYVRRHGCWLIPRSMMTRRLRRLRNMKLRALLGWAPIAFAATAFDWMVFISANRLLARGKGVGLW